MKVNLKKGISLVEIAIGLLVIGLIMAMAVAYMQSVAETKRIFDLNNDISRASEKVIEYAIQNGRVPDHDDFNAMLSFKPTHTITYAYDATLFDASFNRVNSICATVVQNVEAYRITGRAPRVRPTANNRFEKIVSINELKDAMGCDKTASVLTITTPSLPNVDVMNAYTADVRAIGGRPDYFWCAEIDEDIAGIKSSNPALFGNCKAPATWNKMVSARINIAPLPKNTLAQTRVLIFYVKDQNDRIAQRPLTLFINNY